LLSAVELRTPCKTRRAACIYGLGRRDVADGRKANRTLADFRGGAIQRPKDIGRPAVEQNEAFLC